MPRSAADSAMDTDRARIRKEYAAALRAGFGLDRTLRLVTHVRNACLRWNRQAGVEEPLAREVVRRVLVHAGDLAGSPVTPERAADCVLAWWRAIAQGEAVPPVQRPPGRDEEGQAEERLALYLSAVADVLLEGEVQASARHGLRALRLSLDLSYDDLGRALGTSGESVRRWERGTVDVPHEARARISAAQDALHRLTRFFKPSRLPEVIRRPARIFDGQRAIDRILRGEIADVVARYDVALSYQG